MAKTYRHVFKFEGIRPLDKVKSIATYERLKDVPECGGDQMMSSGPTKTPRCTGITCGTFQVGIANMVNMDWSIEGAVKFIESLEYGFATPEEVNDLEDSKKKALEFLYGNEYGEASFGKLKVTIKSRIAGD